LDRVKLADTVVSIAMQSGCIAEISTEPIACNGSTRRPGK